MEALVGGTPSKSTSAFRFAAIVCLGKLLVAPLCVDSPCLHVPRVSVSCHYCVCALL